MHLESKVNTVKLAETVLSNNLLRGTKNCTSEMETRLFFPLIMLMSSALQVDTFRGNRSISSTSDARYSAAYHESLFAQKCIFSPILYQWRARTLNIFVKSVRLRLGDIYPFIP